MPTALSPSTSGLAKIGAAWDGFLQPESGTHMTAEGESISPLTMVSMTHVLPRVLQCSTSPLRFVDMTLDLGIAPLKAEELKKDEVLNLAAEWQHE